MCIYYLLQPTSTSIYTLNIILRKVAKAIWYFFCSSAYLAWSLVLIFQIRISKIISDALERDAYIWDAL